MQIQEGFCLPDHLDKLKNDYITAAMKKTGGNVSQAAALLGMKRTTLRMHMHARDLPASVPVSPMVDPEGEFTVKKNPTGWTILYKGEEICRKRNIKEVNKFIREKIS